VAVGNFDGVHLGHAAIARALRETAAALGKPAVVLTFDPHPAAVVRPDSAPVPLTTPARRAELLAALGMDGVLVQRTDRSLTSLEPAEFYERVLKSEMAAAALVEGTDFRFGRERQGDIHWLATACAADGLGFVVVPPVEAAGMPVSSSRIRALVTEGAVADAAALLTAPYRISGTVVEGMRRGRALGFPTANLSAIATLRPAGGVYAGVARPHGANAATYPAAIHIGPTATFGGTKPAVEVHLIGFAGSLYGATLDVDFLARLRDTRRFDSGEQLASQLREDVERAARVAETAKGRPGVAADSTVRDSS
jgi:riboflavin kinase/FMN adenylyltransferase